MTEPPICGVIGDGANPGNSLPAAGVGLPYEDSLSGCCLLGEQFADA